MREYTVPTLILLVASAAAAQTVPAGWKVMKESKGSCQIAVPPEWVPLEGSAGAAVFRDVSTGLAVVTFQPDQAFKPLSVPLLKVLDIPKERMFENSAKRIFYQDKASKNSGDSIAFTASVPAGGSTCSCHVVALPSVTEEIVKKIASSLAPVTEPAGDRSLPE